MTTGGADDGDSGAPVKVLVTEAQAILRTAAERHLTLRVFGGIGIFLEADDEDIFDQLGRGPAADIDLVGVKAEKNQYKALLSDMGYEIDRAMTVATEGRRFWFFKQADARVMVDLFIDELDMCHRIDLKSRLALRDERLPVSDLLLQKLQIVQLNWKDMVDATVLLLKTEIRDGDETAIDAAYIAAVLSEDWGFWYTAVTNLTRLSELVDEFELGEEQRTRVQQQILRLRETIDDAPKSRRWKLRARVGTKKQWYQDVDEPDAAY